VERVRRALMDDQQVTGGAPSALGRAAWRAGSRTQGGWGWFCSSTWIWYWRREKVMGTIKGLGGHAEAPPAALVQRLASCTAAWQGTAELGGARGGLHCDYCARRTCSV